MEKKLRERENKEEKEIDRQIQHKGREKVLT